MPRLSFRENQGLADAKICPPSVFFVHPLTLSLTQVASFKGVNKYGRGDISWKSLIEIYIGRRS